MKNPISGMEVLHLFQIRVKPVGLAFKFCLGAEIFKADFSFPACFEVVEFVSLLDLVKIYGCHILSVGVGIFCQS